MNRNNTFHATFVVTESYAGNGLILNKMAKAPEKIKQFWRLYEASRF